jgi:hypothetical protein
VNEVIRFSYESHLCAKFYNNLVKLKECGLSYVIDTSENDNRVVIPLFSNMSFIIIGNYPYVRVSPDDGSLSLVQPTNIDVFIGELPEFIKKMSSIDFSDFYALPNMATLTGIDRVREYLDTNGIEYNEVIKPQTIIYIFDDVHYQISGNHVTFSYRSICFIRHIYSIFANTNYLVDIRKHILPIEKIREYKLKNLIQYD